MSLTEQVVPVERGFSPRAPSARPWHKEVGVELDHVSAAYTGRHAFTDVTGTFAAGSLTAVVGPNGAGKSSLLKAIAGTLRLQSGTIVCAARHHHDLAYLPQQTELDRLNEERTRLTENEERLRDNYTALKDDPAMRKSTLDKLKTADAAIDDNASAAAKANAGLTAAQTDLAAYINGLKL